MTIRLVLLSGLVFGLSLDAGAQAGFSGDSTIVFVSGLFLASIASVTSDPVTVPAASRRFTIITGRHTLPAAIPEDSPRTDTTFDQIG